MRTSESPLAAALSIRLIPESSSHFQNVAGFVLVHGYQVPCRKLRGCADGRKTKVIFYDRFSS
jgi:hypothetical protein